MKSCSNTKCSQINPQSLENFSKHKSHKDGKRTRCKNCCLAYNRKFLSTKRGKEYNDKYQKQYQKELLKNDPERFRHNCAKRRAMKLQRTPSWSDLNAIKQFYKECPKGKVVDHIVPLQGREVCGLHVPWNLQYLTKSENSKKGNRFNGECK
jgi:hypothetical protein